MKVLGGSLILKDDTFLFVSKITETVFDDETKDVAISYEDGNGKKKEVKLSQIKEARPVSEQSVFSIMNNIAKMKNENYKGYFITNDGNRHNINLVVSFENLICTVLSADADDHYERKIELRHIKEVHINTNEKYIKEKLSGTFEKYYTLVNGKKEGIESMYSFFSQLGELISMSVYKDGKKEGLHRQWNDTGKLIHKCFYKDDKLEGLYQEWDDNGTLLFECMFKDGEREGELKEWDEDGKLVEHSLYKDGKFIKSILPLAYVRSKHPLGGVECYNLNNGKKEGVYKWYHDNELTLRELSVYKDGERDGEFKKWDENGNLKEHSLYKDGKLIKSLLPSNELTRQFAYIPPETIDKNLGQDLGIEMGKFKKRKVSEYPSVEVPLMDDDLEKVLNRTKEQSYELLKSLDRNEFEITSLQVPNDIYRISYMNKGKNKGYAVLVNRTEDAFILDLNSLFVVKPIVNKVNVADKTPSEKAETDNLPLCKTLIDKKTFYSYSGFSSEIKTIVGLSKALIADGEVMYNFYMKKTLKETMNEKLLKDNLQNDFTILTDELRKGKHEILIYRDNNLVKLIFNFEENTNIYCETYSSVNANVEFHSKPIMANTITVKPLPSHLKYITIDDIPLTPKKEKVMEVPQAPRKKKYKTRAGEETPSIPFLIPEVLQTGDDVEEGVDIPTDRIVTFIYKGDEKRVLVKEANDKYTEGICQTDNKYKKYLTRYIEKVIKVEDPSLDEDTSSEDTSSEDEEPQLNPTYKNMVLNTIKTCYVNGTRGLSRQALQAYIMRNYNVKFDNFHNNLRMTLRRLVETGCIVQTKQKFKLGDEGRKYLKEQKKPKNTIKYDNNVVQEGPIQDAIDNEKILDIMYDGGSIPDIKRPIRPKRVYKASNGNLILQATCLIDDKVKNFSLDKVKVIA